MPLWRALVVFRIAALGYATLLAAGNFRHFAHPAAAWAVIAVMAAWTAVTTYAYTRPRWRGWPLLVADLVITAGCLLVSPWILGDGGHRQGIATLPVSWIAGPVLAWAVSGGRRRGAIAAILLGGCDLAARGHVTQSTLDGTVLLLLAGVAVGHVARLAVDAQERLQRAVEVEAANRERDRLARVIHDSVLQVLALVQRRGAELGGEAAELGRLAGEQEAHLRVLVSAAEPPGRLDLRSALTDRAAGQPAVDLRPLLTRLAGAGVSLATPADPVALPPRVAEELAAAVGAALANVTDHCGPDARAWVLVEDDGDAVTVSVRDEGPGIPAGRLDRAAADGRLGVAQSIRGRMRELGGAVAITSTPGQGTEVELRIPKGTL
jgi:signal transduction histidine kinase